MAYQRTAIKSFELANGAYTNATISFYTIDGAGAATTTLATLYDAPTGSGTLANPHTLDAAGKFSAPVYIDVPVIGAVSNSTVEDHSTGILYPRLSDADVSAAASSAVSAATFAGAASTSAGAASTSAGAADTAKTDAETARDAALAAVGSVRVSSDDTTPGDLEAKLSFGSGLSVSTTNPGANEVRAVAFDLAGSGAASLGANTFTGNQNLGGNSLSNVTGLSGDVLATQAEAEAGANNTELMTPLRTAQAIAALEASAVTLLATATASNDATVEFTSGIDSTYDEYVLHLLDVIPATDTVEFLLRTSSNGGSSFDAGASDYSYVSGGNDSAGPATFDGAGSTTISALKLAANGAGVGSDANETGWSGVVHLVRPATAAYTRAWWWCAYVNSAGQEVQEQGSGRRQAASAVDALQFLFSSGSIESGEFKLYAVKKS